MGLSSLRLSYVGHLTWGWLHQSWCQWVASVASLGTYTNVSALLHSYLLRDWNARTLCLSLRISTTASRRFAACLRAAPRRLCARRRCIGLDRTFAHDPCARRFGPLEVHFAAEHPRAVS